MMLNVVDADVATDADIVDVDAAVAADAAVGDVATVNVHASDAADDIDADTVVLVLIDAIAVAHAAVVDGDVVLLLEMFSKNCYSKSPNIRHHSNLQSKQNVDCRHTRKQANMSSIMSL